MAEQRVTLAPPGHPEGRMSIVSTSSPWVTLWQNVETAAVDPDDPFTPDVNDVTVGVGGNSVFNIELRMRLTNFDPAVDSITTSLQAMLFGFVSTQGDQTASRNHLQSLPVSADHAEHKGSWAELFDRANGVSLLDFGTSISMYADNAATPSAYTPPILIDATGVSEIRIRPSRAAVLSGTASGIIECRTIS